MQTGRVKGVITIQHALDGKRDAKRMMKAQGKRSARHIHAQVIRASVKNSEFEDLDIAAVRV
jgi:hypothetical protein